jgi:hypothetical protein
VIGGDDGNRLASITNPLPRQHGLVGDLHPVDLSPRHVLVSQHGEDAQHRFGL